MKLCKRKGVMCECLTDHSTCNSDNCHRKLRDIEFTSEEVKHSLEDVGIELVDGEINIAKPKLFEDVDERDLTDEECDAIAKEAYDNLVHSLIEAGGEIRFLRELLMRAYEQLLLIGYDSSFTNEEIYKLVNEIKEYLEEIK